MSQIVIKYHNDFNRVKLPSFNEQEQNLLFTIFGKIKEKGAGETISLTPQDLQINESLANSRQYLTDTIDSLKEKFFKANFRQIIETPTSWIDSTFNLFQTMNIHYTKRDPHDPFDPNKLFERIDLVVNPLFAHLVNDLTANFTRFELDEFLRINGKYAKTLYRLLKQYRNTGKISIFKNDWQGFCELMDIPTSYPSGMIDKRILKPSIKELSAERDLFNQSIPIFENLTYKKVKDKKGRGRGGKVIGIEFFWNPDIKRTELNEQIKNIKATTKKLNAAVESLKSIEARINPITGEQVSDLTSLIGQHFFQKNDLLGGYDTCKITQLYQAQDGRIYGKAINQENGKIFDFSSGFDSIQHIKNALKLS